MDFHSSMVTKVPELLSSTTAGQKGQCATYKQDLCILQQNLNCHGMQKRMIPLSLGSGMSKCSSDDNGRNKTVLTKGKESENEVEGGGSSNSEEPR